MGLNDNIKHLIDCVADNDIQKAKAYCKVIIKNETSASNQRFCKQIKTKLETPAANCLELPHDIKGLLTMEDVAVSFNEARYYLTAREQPIFEQIKALSEVNNKLAEMGIWHINSTLLFGESGTGKTTFGRYVAYKLGLPFAYLNFSHCIDSYLGGTGKNIKKVFDFACKQKCVLMLDEIDAIGMKRGSGSETGEMSRVVIGLMQAFDTLQNDVVVIGATNRADILDEALLRRFSLRHEVATLEAHEVAVMVSRYLNDVCVPFDKDNIAAYAQCHTKQSEITCDMVKAIVHMLMSGDEFIL